MKDRIQIAFGDIRADNALLEKTVAYLQEERVRRDKKRNRIRPLRLVGALAAMLGLVVGLLGYRVFYSEAVAYVSIDVNPSLELMLNRMDKVIAAAAYNSDGKALLQQVNVNDQQCEKAVSILLAEMEKQGYISNDALVTMTVQTTDGEKEQRLCNALLQSVGGQIGDAQAKTEIEVLHVTQEVRENAQGCHMSAGKYLAIQQLMEVDETATLEAYSDSTIQGIRQKTQACREEDENDDLFSGSEHHYNGQNHDGSHGHNGNHGSR